MNTKELIKKYNIRLTKSLGQNFLIDESVIRRIVEAAEVAGEDTVMEVGPGVGNMTRELALRAGRVIAVEIDKYLISALTENLNDFSNVEIVNEDVLKFDIRKHVLNRPNVEKSSVDPFSLKVVANLPYYITTSIIMKFLEEVPETDTMVFMVQKEVADRMTAKPGGKDYGALTVAVQYYSVPQKVMDVPPHCFIPQPEVDSTVIRLNINNKPTVELKSKEVFFQVIKAAFGQRRKTLANALYNSGYFMKSKEEINNILKGLAIDGSRRGETLSIEQFAAIANSL